MKFADPHKTTFSQLIDAGILSIGDGYRAKNVELGGNGRIFLRAGHVTDSYIDFSDVEHFHAHLEQRLVDKMSMPGDVIITTKGNSTGRTSYVTSDMPQFVYSPHLSRWRSLNLDVLCPGFLRYWSRGREFTVQLDGMKASTDMAPYLSLRDQQRLRITLPHITGQRAIAEILGSLDDKIELNRRMNRTLEEMAAAIFKAWFVDFDPVKAKAAGAKRFPSMPQDVFDSLPTTFTDSPLGPIPKGWGVGTVADTLCLSKVTVDPGEYPTEVFDHFSIPAFDEGQMPKRELGEGIKSNKFEVVSGCVLVSKLNPRIPRVWLPPAWDGVRQVASTEFLVCIPRGVDGREYVYALTSAPSFQEMLVSRATGTSGSHQRVKPDDLLGVEVVMPPKETAAAFAQLAQPLFSLTAAHRKSSANLAAIRDTLLPKLLSGEIRVKDAEKVTREVG